MRIASWRCYTNEFSVPVGPRRQTLLRTASPIESPSKLEKVERKVCMTCSHTSSASTLPFLVPNFLRNTCLLCFFSPPTTCASMFAASRRHMCAVGTAGSAPDVQPAGPRFEIEHFHAFSGAFSYTKEILCDAPALHEGTASTCITGNCHTH